MTRELRYFEEEQPIHARFFIDSLIITGDLYLIPAAHRFEWQAYDTAAADTHEPGPLPEWATPVAELSHIEFWHPTEVM